MGWYGRTKALFHYMYIDRCVLAITNHFKLTFDQHNDEAFSYSKRILLLSRASLRSLNLLLTT